MALRRVSPPTNFSYLINDPQVPHEIEYFGFEVLATVKHGLVDCDSLTRQRNVSS